MDKQQRHPLRNSTTYRAMTGATLAFLVLQAVVFKEMHHLLEHAHEEMLRCAAPGSEKHLHSEEYAPEDCFVCFLHFAPAQPGLVELPKFTLEVTSAKIPFGEQQSVARRTKWHFQRRGPPAAAA